jgi:hypothetical protein
VVVPVVVAVTGTVVTLVLSLSSLSFPSIHPSIIHILVNIVVHVDYQGVLSSSGEQGSVQVFLCGRNIEARLFSSFPFCCSPRQAQGLEPLACYAVTSHHQLAINRSHWWCGCQKMGEFSKTVSLSFACPGHDVLEEERKKKEELGVPSNALKRETTRKRLLAH